MEPDENIAEKRRAMAEAYIASLLPYSRVAGLLSKIRLDFECNPTWLDNDDLIFLLVQRLGAERINGALAPVRRNRSEIERAIIERSDISEIERRVLMFCQDPNRLLCYKKLIDHSNKEYQERIAEREAERKKAEAAEKAAKLKKINQWSKHLNRYVEITLPPLKGQSFIFQVVQLSAGDCLFNEDIMEMNGICFAALFKEDKAKLGTNGIISISHYAECVREVPEQEVKKKLRAERFHRQMQLKN